MAMLGLTLSHHALCPHLFRKCFNNSLLALHCLEIALLIGFTDAFSRNKQQCRRHCKNPACRTMSHAVTT